jgi:hypothetical protein
MIQFENQSLYFSFDKVFEALYGVHTDNEGLSLQVFQPFSKFIVYRMVMKLLLAFNNTMI